jgi:hypothetical protein
MGKERPVIDNTTAARCSVGIDVSKDALDIFIDSPTAECRVANRAGEIAAVVERLKSAGKVSKVALVACSRKLLTILNAMVRDRTKWDAERAQQTG